MTLKAPDMLKSFVDRIERLNEQIVFANAMKRDIYADARMSGIDPVAVKLAVDRRWQEAKANKPLRPVEAARSAGVMETLEAFRQGIIISQDFRYRDATVYFVHFPEFQRLKIGISTNLARRISDLSAANGAQPVLLGFYEGNRQAEMAAHEKFSKFLIAGEWFEYSHECARMVEGHLAAKLKMLEGMAA